MVKNKNPRTTVRGFLTVINCLEATANLDTNKML